MYIHFMFCPSEHRLPLTALLCCSALAPGPLQSRAAAPTNSIYWAKAQQTHTFVLDNLSAGSAYRINPATNTVYEWYAVSQIYADAAMVQAGDARYLAPMNDAFAWMTNLWDETNPIGGYFSAGTIQGTGKGGGKYVDDNALTGNVYLDCYQASTDAKRSNYLNAAVATAQWLIASGQWDKTYGGGFWWSDSKTVKPTQSNGLALQLFLRLYALTGKTAYRDWANSVDGWLETQMYDASDGLYLWQIETNGFKNPLKFTYDNGIMIEAQLLYSQVVSNSSYLGKAQTLASNLNAKLWNKTYKAYSFNSGDGRVNPCWCGWASQSLTRLYQADKNPIWLEYARQNIDFMNDHLRNPSNGGYFAFGNLDGSNIDSRREGVDQAWMQRIQALIASYR